MRDVSYTVLRPLSYYANELIGLSIPWPASAFHGTNNAMARQLRTWSGLNVQIEHHTSRHAVCHTKLMSKQEKSRALCQSMA